MSSTGTLFKLIRQEHELTQSELGEILGLKKSAIQKYESGAIRNFKSETIRKLCERFELPSYLFIAMPEDIDISADKLKLMRKIHRLNIEALESISSSSSNHSIHDVVMISKITQELFFLDIKGLGKVHEYSKDMRKIYSKE